MRPGGKRVEAGCPTLLGSSICRLPLFAPRSIPADRGPIRRFVETRNTLVRF